MAFFSETGSGLTMAGGLARTDDHAGENRIYPWLTLLQAAAVTGRDLSPLLDRFGSAAALVEAAATGELDRSRLPGKALERLQKPDEREIELSAEWLEGAAHHLITPDSPAYPPLLRHIPSPPPGLFVRGDPGVLLSAQVAIVGSRKPGIDGRKDAGYFAGELARRGITVTSGMAQGIDTEAHRGALLQRGRTVAVTGSGLKCIYPGSNAGLADRISDEGAVVSEFPLSCKPLAGNFPRRNRIISGLSVGVLVVEATRKSGSLITARHALEQNREVFAVPGSIRNPRKRGCHWLLREGARLVECVEDILAEIARPGEPGKPAPAAPPPPEETNGLDEKEKVLLDNIGYEPTSLDEIVAMTAFHIEDVTGRLLKLELAGLITAASPGRYLRLSRRRPGT